MRLAVCGPGESGKNVTSVFLRDNLNLNYVYSTSEYVADVVYEKISNKNQYASARECWEDRRSHRVEWADIIKEYNQPDGIGLYREMLASHDILDGIRRGAELAACQDIGLVDLSIWIQRDGYEDESLDYGPDACDIAILNNGTIQNLHTKLGRLFKIILNQ
jgi:hypothetical protein